MIDIKDINGNVIQSVIITQNAERVIELMKADYVQLSWSSDEGAILPAGAYIEYKGEKFSLLEPYTPEQKDELEYEYKPQFQSKVMAWGKTPLFLYTQTESGIRKETDWVLTDNPANFMSYIADALHKELGEQWNYAVSTDLAASATISFSTSDIYSALNAIANAFETEWWVDKEGYTIHLGKCQHGNAIDLEVGVNVKTPSITRNKEGYFTRFYAFGSTRNIEQDYEGANANNIVNKRLTLDPTKYPQGYKDIREGLKAGEIFSKVLIFDDIYPSSKLSISNVRVRLLYRLDDDNNKVQVGTDSNGKPIYDQYAIWYFQIPNFTYDKENVIEGLVPSINFKTGALAGREFEIIYHDKDKEVTTTDGEPFKVLAGDYEICFIEEGTYIIPSVTGLTPTEGDEIVLFNIKMPEEYKQSAYDELEEALDKEIARMNSDLNTYQLQSDAVAFYNDNPNLTLGQKVRYTNGAYSFETRVMKLVTKLDYECEQAITIGNEKIKGNTEQLKEEVVNANTNINFLAALNETTNSLTQAYQRTQKMMMEGFASIKDMWLFDEKDKNTIYSKFNIYSLGYVSAKGANPNTGGNEGGATTLGGLRNVAADADRTYDVAKMLVLEAKSNLWTLKNLSELVGGLDEAELAEYLTNNNYAKKSDIPSLSGYATEQWVLGKGYATTSDLDNRINALVNGAPAAYDTLKEIADVLAGNVNSISDILTALGNKAEKATTLSGYGITDAYTITQIDSIVNGLSGNISTLQGYFTDGVANSALRLSDNGSYTAWGQTFFANGKPKSVSGALTDVTDITSSGTITTNKIVIGNGTIEWDEANKGFKIVGGLYTESYLSAKGANTNGGSSSGGGLIESLFRYADLGKTFADTNNDTFNAYTINKINTDLGNRISVLEGKATNVSFTQSLTSGTQIGTITIDGVAKNIFAPTIPTDDINKGVTAYGWGNHANAGYAMASALGGYLPLKGGTLTDTITFNVTSSYLYPIIKTAYNEFIDYRMNIHLGATSGYFNIFDDSENVLLRIDKSSGNVGIGITSPQYKLDVNGTINGTTLYQGGKTLDNYYLPLSGGTITGDLSLNQYLRIKAWVDYGSGSCDMWYNGNTGILHLTASNIANYHGETYIHSGNIGSQSVASANRLFRSDEYNISNSLQYLELYGQNSYGDAPTNDYYFVIKMGHGDADTYYNRTLAFSFWNDDIYTRSKRDGVGYDWKKLAFITDNVASADVIASTYANQSINMGAESRVRLISITSDNAIDLGAPKRYVSGLSVMSNYVGWQLVSGASQWNNEDFYIRKIADNGVYLDWRQIAFTDSNVASATKLQTARSIWGQSFDGTGDVSGDLHLYTSKIYWWGDAANYCIESVQRENSSPYLKIAHYGGISFNTGGYERMCIAGSGNVGIGTTSPQYKLDVNGTFHSLSDIYSNGYIFLNSGGDGIYIANGAIAYHDSTNGWIASLINFLPNEVQVIQNARFEVDVNVWGTIHSYTGIWSDGYVSAKGQNTSSDMRLKNVLNEVVLGVKDIANAPSMRFSWKNGGGVDVGSSAQYWQLLLPDAVKERDGMLEMQYANIALLSAIAIAKNVETHEERIARLEKENKELRNEIMILKGGSYA